MSAAVAEAFKRLQDQGLIYRDGYKVNGSPTLCTAVSDLEVEFSEENEKLYYFRYPLSNGSGFIPVATTRPETILGDTTVCVHPVDERYSQYVGETVLFLGTERDIPVIADEYVDRECVIDAPKITPCHDHNDHELGKKHNLPKINILTKDANLNSNRGNLAGLDRFEARGKLWDSMATEALVDSREDCCCVFDRIRERDNC
ncbi:Valine--tRNA ligase [Gracilariopsis chorda]|uniref:valine--tRNA ligase n=1 Tax=Gracilariopsis chorda TaxID=448386 RepID=A0A2V3IDP8_9FLOR|nr:Valine--tRNA ligase [Gracilariopsis chorda]|eukprot:PXF40206.1 Valine--tRNA ligase [Gracilariopsis chorda]